jgi:hypothetical protein
MPRREKKPPATPAAAPPSLDALLAGQAATDPHAWEAMLNLNKMRSARRKLAQSDAPPPATKDRD